MPLYSAGTRLAGLLRGSPQRLTGRVVSVGSLSAGGAGKTPVVMLAAEMLREAGFAVDVLSRGYGRTGTGVERVEADGSTERYGDEPMLMARKLGVPVWVGARRVAAGRAAEAADPGGSLVHVLDDGFQHRQLARNVDVVLLTQEDVEDRLLPGGNLREGLEALERAHVVVLREEEAAALRMFLPAGRSVWVVRREMMFDRQVPERVVVFCGIARPEGFVSMLGEVGVVGTEIVRFKDHHRYTERDAAMLVERARRDGAMGFVTTEKDAVKMTGVVQRMLAEIGPMVVAELRLKLVEGSVEDMLRRLR